MFIYKQILRSRGRRWRKAPAASVPTICVGNVTVGGTGKTPHTELILRLLQASPKWGGHQYAMLSRGYKRRSRGFQQVLINSSAGFAGDEPLQIKKKFPGITVAVDKDRVEGCAFLANPEKMKITGRRTRRIADNRCRPSEIIVLDDAFQYNRLHASLNLVLVDYSRPVFEDSLLPFGRLRDLPERIFDSDIIVVSKSPRGLTDWEKTTFSEKLKLQGYQSSTGICKTPEGRTIHLLFSYMDYCPLLPVYPEADTRYSYSKSVVLFTGIANDSPLKAYLSDSYKILSTMSFPDHHKFSRADIAQIAAAVRRYPTSALITTEKDAQRILDSKNVPVEVRTRLFMLPIMATFSSKAELEVLEAALEKL